MTRSGAGAAGPPPRLRGVGDTTGRHPGDARPLVSRRGRAASRVMLVGGMALLATGAGVLASIVLSPMVAAGGAPPEAAALERAWPKAAPRASTSAPPVTPAVATGRAFGVLKVPRFGAGYARVIAEGVSGSAVLDRGALGHYGGTAMPGAVGNFAIAGHRAAAGGTLLHLPDLRRGDPVVVETATAVFTYRVTSGGITPPSDVAAIAPVPGHPSARPTRRYITLQTCTPAWVDTDRYIVHGELASWRAR